MIIYIDNTNVLTLSGVTNSVTGDPVTDADVEVTLIDASGDEVAGETWPVAMGHVSDGDYRVTLSSEIQLNHRRRYRAVVDAVGSGVVGHWETPVQALIRT